VRVLLTRDQIRDAPDVETDKPVSRQQEERLAAYYTWPSYWTMPHGVAAPPALQRQAVEQAEAEQAGARTTDPHLRSLREVTGYRIKARDGWIGHVQDFVGEDTTWVIRYMVGDTRHWLRGQRVLISPAWVDAVDWHGTEVRVDLDKEGIEHAPAYDPTTPITREYETQLHSAHRRPAYWNGRDKST
jgi:hypothetical protein